MDDSFEHAERLGVEVRASYRAGEKPSALIRTVFARVPSAFFVIKVFRAAFDLSLEECKMASDFWPGGSPDRMDDEGMDAYLVALIEAARPRWDRADEGR